MGLLKEVASTTATITLPQGKKAKVRGLSLGDVGWLMGDHTKEISQLFEGIVNIDDVVTRWPVFTAKAIAVAMDEKEDWEYAQKLPVTVQLEAIMRIWDLTILDTAVLGKVYERLTSTLNQLGSQAFDKSKNPTGKGTTSKPLKGSPRVVTVGKKSLATPSKS